jgi:hypothetical protein
MYPHERSLVKRLAGKAFALLGINSDKNLEDLHATMVKEEITWPSWFDGGSTGGPIASLYEVRSWPSTFVLDPNGVIRFKDVRGKDLDKAVDRLLEEFGSTNTSLPSPNRQPPVKSSRRRSSSRGTAKTSPDAQGTPESMP